jgi:hypothetical protein
MAEYSGSGLRREERLAAKNYDDTLRVNQETIEAQIASLEADLERARL